MAIYLRGEVYWIKLTHGGRKVRRSAGTGDKQEAQRKHDELKASLWKEKRAGKVFFDALDEWVAAKPRHVNQLLSVKQIRKTYADRPLIDVTGASVLETYKELHPANYNRLANIIRAAMNVTAELGWIEAAPKIKIKKEPRPVANEDPLTVKQWKALRAELPDHLLLMADFAIATGLRWSNVAKMEWHRIDLTRKYTWVPGSKAKAGEPIPVPLSASALAVLRKAPKPHEGFVFRYNGKPIKSGKTAWLKALTRVGLKCKFTWHGLRHTWASWHAMGGTPMDVLQKLGGWESPEMVKRYAHLDPTYIARFVNNARVPRQRAA